MAIRIRLRRDDRPKLARATADALAAALGVTENRVRVYASQGMPHWDGAEACRAWLRSRPGRMRAVPLVEHATAASRATADVEPAAEVTPPAVPPDDLSALLHELPDELKAMPPRDAYEWLRVLKLQRQLRTDAADRISREQALQMLVERARVLRQTLLSIPRRLRHLLSDETHAALTREIRAALNTYGAPEGYLDHLLPTGVDANDVAALAQAVGGGDASASDLAGE